MPSPTLPAQIRAALAAQGLTLYGAAQIVGAETDESLKAVHNRLTRYVSDPPPLYLEQLESALDALGYKIQVLPK